MTLTNSKRLVIAIIFITLLSLIITIPASADVPAVYVDDDFDGKSDGSKRRPFKSLNEAGNYAKTFDGNIRYPDLEEV